MTATAIAHLLSAHAEELCSHLLSGGKRHGNEWLAGSLAGEAGSSLHVILEGERAGVWRDFAGSDTDKGDLIGLWQRTRNVTLSQACQEALDWMEVPHELRNTRTLERKEWRSEVKAPDQRWLELQATMRAGSHQELNQLAELRHLPGTAGLALATRHGQLWFADVHDHGERHPAWIVTDGSRRNAQARKMDGSMWIFDGVRKPAKSKTIWGTDTHWPVGITEATTPHIAFVEGGPDFLAAWHLIWMTDSTAHVRPVAMFGASNAIHEEALPLFDSKFIWMFPHNDDKQQGEKAAAKWGNQLRPYATIQFNDFKPDGVKDLNELVTAEALMEDET